MCAVIGVILHNPSKQDLEIVKFVFHESKIRGMHATGLSYVKNGEIITKKLPVPADQFPFNFPDYINEDGNLYLVGHCRYSTSDLEYNQPISNNNLSVVHNGVITQELPERWKELYGYSCETKNDTELLLHTIEDGLSPLQHWKDASMSVCVLNKDKSIKVFRNGKRPLYLTSLGNGSIITSTGNIPARVGIQALSVEVPVNTYVTFDNELTMIVEKETIDGSVDYQHYEDTDY
jgi:glutamine phosphoribosylpyrophosphate amidotransferase